MSFELEKMNIEHRTSNIEHRMGNQRTEDTPVEFPWGNPIQLGREDGGDNFGFWVLGFEF